jgi:hypothetical protein
MGIKYFSKCFTENSGEIKYKDLKGKNIVIDASVEIYRACLAMKQNEALKDSSGRPSIHINSILLGIIIKLKSFDINQYWIFDQLKERNHNPMKQLEIEKRKLKRHEAKEKLEILNEKLNNITISKTEKLSKKESEKTKRDKELFSSDEDDQEDQENDQIEKNIRDEIDKKEKIAFNMKEYFITDVIFMLDMLGITWIECPVGFEAEQLAAFATTDNKIFGVYMDYVLTPDVDCLLFGARKMIKRDIRKKKFFLYELDKLLEEYNITQDELIKVGLVLGCDFADKTPRIGPKTVLKKLDTIILTNKQQEAMDTVFKKTLSKNDIALITKHNIDKLSFTDSDKYLELLDWLQYVKSYNRERIITAFTKAKLFI